MTERMAARHVAGPWASTLSALNTGLAAVERTAARFAAAAVLAMMAIVVVDVLGRYLFNSPLTWSYDLVSLFLMPLIVFLALANTFRRNNHIAVDLLYGRFGEITRRLSRLLTALIVAGTVLPIAWLASDQAIERSVNKSMIAGSILWPTWIPSAFLAVGAALLVLRAILDGAALATALARRLHVPRTRIERLVREETAVTADTAMRLAKAFGTTPEYWMNLQRAWDLARARDTVDVSDITPVAAA